MNDEEAIEKLRKLYPDLSSEELEAVRDSFDRLLSIVLRIHLRTLNESNDEKHSRQG